MVYTSGKMKGQLTTTEIRKLIRAHNVLVSIKIPAKSTRDDIMKLLDKNGYGVDHEAQALVPKVEMKRRPKVDMKKADKVLPKPKTKEEKATSKATRDKVKKDKEDKIKAEGVRQGSALQKAFNKKNEAKKPKPAPVPPKPKSKPSPKKSPVLQLGDKDEETDSFNKNRCQRAINSAGSIIMFYERDGGDFKTSSLFKNKKDYMESVEDLSGNWGSCSQKDQTKIRKALSLHKNPPKKETPKNEPPAKFGTKKGLRKRLDMDFRKKYGMNIYQALEIPNNSDPSPAEVKKTCRMLKLKNHPDKGGDEEKFKAIQEACDIMVETFTEEGQGEVDVSPAIIKTQKDAISKYVKELTLIFSFC